MDKPRRVFNGIILVVTILIILFFLTDRLGQEDDQLEKNKELARRWSDEIWGKGSPDAVDELLAAEFVFNYAPPGVGSDLEGYKKTVTMWSEPFSDISCTVEEMIAEGNKVAVRWTWRGTHTGEYMGVSPTGKEMKVTGISILHIKDGNIVEEWGEMDNLGMMQQLGLVPSTEE